MESLSPEKITQIKAILKEMDFSAFNNSIIQDNKLIFSFKEKYYRVRMPNQIEQTLAEEAQNKLKIRLSRTPGNISRNQLIKELKENTGLDIIQMEKDQEKLKQELQDVYLEGALISSEDSIGLESNRKKKDVIEAKFMENIIEISEALAPCIQEQAKVEYYRYLAYICTEERIKNDEYKPVWASYEDYQKDDSGLTIQAVDKIQALLLNVKEN